jgi:putative lipoic acid-binding regulatory protein
MLSSWVLLLVACLAVIDGFSLSKPSPRTSFQRLSDKSSNEEEEEMEIMSTPMKIDDGGSDLTDRFKYKMHALMGTYDPQGTPDTESESGNILGALLTFPVCYSFNVVGRVGEEEGKQEFINQVKSIIQKGSGDDAVVCQVTPRGTKFTKVTVEAQVDSALIITNIYNELGAIEQCVMKF